MNELINKTNQTPIEIALCVDGNGMTTARKLYEFLELAKGQFSRWCKANILENTFADEGIDYIGFDINVEGNGVKDYKLTAAFAKKLSMTAKNKKGEEARDYFVGVEDGAKKMAIAIQDMSPELRLLINMEMEQKRQAKEINNVKETQKTIAQALGKDIDESFRSWVNHSLSAIAESENYQYIGSPQERHQAIRAESYERLNAKRPCNLSLRVERAQGRSAAAGVSQTRIKAINKLTVIEGDKDLKPVYESVVREMLIAYCIALQKRDVAL